MDNNNFSIITQQEFRKLISQGLPYEYAFIMSCEKGNQTELSKPLIDRMKEDQEILQRETLVHLVPFEPTPVITTQAVVIGVQDDPEKKNNE